MSDKNIISEHMRKIGARGGKATAEKLSPSQRKKMATKAANARWNAVKNSKD